MKRRAFTMRLKPGAVAEYRRRHAEIWQELTQLIRQSDVFDYSIFLDETTLTLFAVQKVSDNYVAANLSSHPIMKKWWVYMAPLMEVNSDDSPACRELEEVFHLE